MKKIVLVLGLVLSFSAQADAEKRTLTNEEINSCKALASMAAQIQDIRVTNGVGVWDFYYKYGVMMAEYTPDQSWHLIRKVYSEVPEGVHPAHVYKSLFLHCTKYTFESKPEIAYNI
jgi:hypothetical protein